MIDPEITETNPMTSNPDSESKPVLLPRLSLAAVDRPIALILL